MVKSLFVLDRDQLGGEPLQVSRISPFALALAPQALLQPRSVEGRKQADTEASGERQPEALPGAALGAVVQRCQASLLLDKRLPVQRLHVLRHANDSFPTRHHAFVEEAPGVGRPVFRWRREHRIHRQSKVEHFTAQPLQAVEFDVGSEYRLVSSECFVDGGRCLFEALQRLRCRRGRRVQQRVADVDGAEQHLRAYGREQILGLRVAGVQTCDFILQRRHPSTDVVAGEEPDAEGETEAEDEGGLDSQAMQASRSHRGILLPPSAAKYQVQTRWHPVRPYRKLPRGGSR